MKVLPAVVLLVFSAAALPAAAEDGTKFFAERWAMLETVTLAPAEGGVLVTASGSSDGQVTATLVAPDGNVYQLGLEREAGAFVLEALAPGGPWAADGLHTLAFEGPGGRDEVPVEMEGGALAPDFGSASRSADGTVEFQTWSMIRSASVESRGGIDVVEVVAETARTAPVTVSLSAPDGSSSVIERVEPRGQYSFSAVVGGQLWSQDGDYTVVFEQPGSPPYKDDLILPVSGGAVALPVTPAPRDAKVSEVRWSDVDWVDVSEGSLSVSGSSDRPLDVTLLSPEGVSVVLGTIEPGPGGSFDASYDLSGSTGTPGAYVVEFGDGGDVLLAYLGLGPGVETGGEKWVMIDRAEALAGDPDVLEVRGLTGRAAPVSASLFMPGGAARALPQALPSDGAFSVSVPAAGWVQDGLYAVVLEQPGSPPYRDVFTVAVEDGKVLRPGKVQDVKASGARWSAVEKVVIEEDGAHARVSVSGSSEGDLGARLVAPGGGSTDLGTVSSDKGRIALDLDTSGNPWGGGGTYAIILEGEGVRDSVPLVMDGRRAADGFGDGGVLEQWRLIETASVSRSGGPDVLSVRGTAGDGPVSVSLMPPGGPLTDLGDIEPSDGLFEFDLEVDGGAWSRDGVYAVSFEQEGDRPARDLVYLDVRGGAVVPEFGAAVLALAAAAGAGAAARRLVPAP